MNAREKLAVYDDSFELAGILREFATKYGGTDPELSYYLSECAAHIEGLYLFTKEEIA